MMFISCKNYCQHLIVVGSYDFFGLNHYTTVRTANVNPDAQIDYYNDMDIVGDFDEKWET